MIVRSLDGNHDWNFGKGKNDYYRNNDAVTQNIDTRLLSFKNDCFFDANAGIDWWNLLGSKNLPAIKLAVTSIILNTEGVTGLIELSVNLSDTREVEITYRVTTVYSLNQSLGNTITVGGV